MFECSRAATLKINEFLASIGRARTRASQIYRVGEGDFL